MKKQLATMMKMIMGIKNKIKIKILIFGQTI